MSRASSTGRASSLWQRLRPSWRAQAACPRLFLAARPPAIRGKVATRGKVEYAPSAALTAVRCLLAAGFLAFASHAFAVNPNERLADPKLEARAEAIGQTLRCLVCQNESIEESNADLAHDIRVLLRQLLAQGDTDEQARQAIVARYGEFVLLKPPVQPATYVLWFAPAALLAVGFAGIVLWLRYRPAPEAGPAPLTPQEEARLDSLLREADR